MLITWAALWAEEPSLALGKRLFQPHAHDGRRIIRFAGSVVDSSSSASRTANCKTSSWRPEASRRHRV